MSQFTPHIHRVPGLSGASRITPVGSSVELDFAHPLARNLQGYWPLAGDANTLIGRTNGTLTSSPSFVGTPLGVQLSTNPGYVNLGQVINPTAVTYCAWIFPTAFTNTYNTVVGRWSSGANYSLLYIKSTGKLALFTTTSGGTPSYDGTGTNTLSVNTPYFVALVYDSSGGLIGYVNGASDATVAAAGTLTTTGASLYIGNDPSTTGRNFPGQIGPVSVYDRALSAAEIAWLYQESFAMLRPRAAWPTRRGIVITSVNGSANPGTGSLTFTGFQPSVSAGVTPGAGSLTFTGFAPTVSAGANVSPGAGSLVFTGLQPSVAGGNANVAVGAGSLTFTGFQPAVTASSNAAPNSGQLTFTGFPPLVTSSSAFAFPGTGTLTFTGYPPTITTDGWTPGWQVADGDLLQLNGLDLTLNGEQFALNPQDWGGGWGTPSNF